MVFAVLGGRFAGPSALAHLPTLARRLEELPAAIDTLVFIDEPLPDAATVSLIDDMVAVFPELGVDVLAVPVPVTEAVKRVEGDRVAEGIDRSALAAVRAPEVLRRAALEEALPGVAGELWVNPTAVVARAGGRIRFYRPGIGARR